MVINIKRSLPPCPRCKGKLLPVPDSADSACFNCGRVVYAVPPPALSPDVGRRPSHGGHSLS